MSLRVALIADWFAPRRGGIETQLLGLAQNLASAGVDIQVITGMPGPVDQQGVPVTRLEGLRLPGTGLVVSPGLPGKIRRALAQISPDVVHIHPSIVAPVCAAGVAATRALDLPTVFTFHSWMVNLPHVLRMADKLSGWTAPPTRITGVSRAIAGQLRGIRRDLDVTVLPNGFDCAFWSADASAPGPSTFSIATAMRFEPKKRPLALPPLLAEVNRSRDDGPVHLVAAGQGSLSAATRRLAARLGVDETFHVDDWRDREGLRALYREASVFVMPSTTESFGIAALEARAAGLPVIARAGVGIADYIRDGLDGYLCNSDAEMAQAIIRLRDNPDLLERMSGPRPDLMRYDWPTIATRHMEIYRELV